MSATSAPPHESAEIDVDSVETSANRLIGLIKPNWVSKKLIFKKLGTDDNKTYYSILPSDIESEQHSIVLKIYPSNSDVYTDHQIELNTMTQLVQYNLAPRILLTFNNGYFSTHLRGKLLDINQENTHKLIARKLSEFHSISLNSDNNLSFMNKLKQLIDLFTKKNPSLQNRLVELKKKSEEETVQNTSFFTTLKSAIGLSSTSPQSLSLEQLESQLKDTSWDELATEIYFMETIFEKTWSKYNLPIVLCLNNVNMNNFLYDSKNQIMSIIDYDHCSYNYFLIDIVSYFLELTQNDAENKYPQRSTQKLFLAEYMKYSSLNLKHFIYDYQKPTDNELERLCDLCGLLIAPVHLYWALWAFLQGLLTKSTFDFMTYGKNRLAQYERYKKNFFHPLFH